MNNSALIMTNKQYQALGKVSRVIAIEVLDDLDGSVLRRLSPSDRVPVGVKTREVKTKVTFTRHFCETDEDPPF